MSVDAPAIPESFNGNPCSVDSDASQRADRLRERLMSLREQMLSLERELAPQVECLAPEHAASARNLLHYVALRHNDARRLQEELIAWGLSSLGRCESHVLANVNAVLEILARLTGQSVVTTAPPVDYAAGRDQLERCTARLLGSKPAHRAAHIMVTMPSSAAEDYALVRELVAEGMSCMRINCAHDEAPQWSKMIDNLRRARQSLGRQCRVLMDLAGPKLRTGSLVEGPRVLKCRPRRDGNGRVSAPARIWLAAGDAPLAPPHPADACLPVDAEFLEELAIGDRLRLRDASLRERRLTVVGRDAGGAWVESSQTVYFVPGLRLRRKSHGGKRHAAAEGCVGDILPVEQPIVLYRGDRLVITDCGQPGQSARYDERGRLIEPARISCTLPQILSDVRIGERVLLDDGKIGGEIREVCPRYFVMEITQARPRGERLGADKGINLPDSDLALDALTAKDLDDLDFIAAHADMVAYSFVRRAEDVHRLQAELASRSRLDLGVVLKIETTQAFARLPSLLLAAKRSQSAGVMIARGDLAVESGFERLAEVQEEILWMCEAAHIPVIWATQVLEQLAKDGVPTRAEITDAAMSVRAECVMLNKGPYIVDAVRVLANILLRMQDHQIKKRPLLRRLELASDLARQVVPELATHAADAV